MSVSLRRAVALGAALLACLATSAAEAPTLAASDTLDTSVVVAGNGAVAWTVWTNDATVDFWNSDHLVIEATTAGIGGTLTLVASANGVTATDTIALSGGAETTATVRLDGILPGCTPTPQGCRTDIALAFTTNIPVDVDLHGAMTVTGDDPGGGAGLSVDLASGS